ncbi:DNA-binding protein inhibitor ID-1 isoform X2 [Narcine bancroftii]|uniref:DNA-binding protein inhibitor ID-1 isoform X2 n=1 Tax=Narcine bancroftii TaxID=1343680 RepID=UPI0038314A14
MSGRRPPLRRPAGIKGGARAPEPLSPQRRLAGRSGEPRVGCVDFPVSMKVVSGAACTLKRQGCNEDVVRCLSEQSIAIAKCKMPPLLDEQMTMFLYDMNGCYSKLKELVPTLPQNKKVSKVEILQHVIDYIWDLQLELDDQTSGNTAPSRTPLPSEAPCVSSDDRILCR